MATIDPVVPQDRVAQYQLAEEIKQVIVMGLVTGPFADLLYQVRDRILQDMSQLTATRTEDTKPIRETARRLSLVWEGDLQKLAESIYWGTM